MKRAVIGLGLAIALAAAPGVVGAQTPASAPAADPSGSSTFVVLLDGTRVGTETVSITRAGNEWLVSGNGLIQPPLDISTMRFEVRYGPDWQPLQLAIEAALRGQPMAMTTSFGLTTATNALTRGDQRGSNTQQITPRAAVVPNNFFAAYESVAVRLPALGVGDRLPVYVPPSGETSVTVTHINPRRVSLSDRTLELKEYLLTAINSAGAIPLEMWVDDRGRLARLVMPTASLVVIREDLANVLAREERLSVEGDDDVFIGRPGFSLGGTITPARGVAGRAPAVILVAGPGPQDRDYVTHGMPLYAQLAQALSQAGYTVVRYDSRGTGRSGGRAESARLQEYVDDVLGVVNWLRDRRDIDRDRIAVVGYGDTGPIALGAAARTGRIARVAVINSPGLTGREVTLERQRLALEAANVPESERANRLAMQTIVLDAVTSGEGWERATDEVRRQADTPWFRSWLLFDPADVVRRIERPVLILHGAVDSEVPPAHAEALAELGRARRNRPDAFTQTIVLPGINHLLLPATTGSQEEYATIEPRTPAPAAIEALTTWLGATIASR